MSDSINDQKNDSWEEKVWYILRQESQFGPYSYLEMVKLLQEKKLREFDYVYTSKLSSWMKVSEVPDFSVEQISALKKLSNWKELREIFYRRKHARAPVSGYLWVHDGKRAMKASPIQMSAGGAAFEVEGLALSIGSELHFHFKPFAEVPPFNAVVEVVSLVSKSAKKFKVGVKFLAIEGAIQKSIKNFTDKVA